MDSSTDAVFDRIAVDRMVAGGTRVSWRLQPHFAGPTPHTFVLQMGESSAATADDWTTVATGTDVASLVDPDPRDLAVAPTAHYRVRLTAGATQYLSRPIPPDSWLNRRDWLVAKSIERRFLLRGRVMDAAPGWLYRRRARTALVTDPLVRDPLGGEVLQTIRTAGVGTARIGGYFLPVEHSMMFVTSGQRVSSRHPQTGPTDNQTVQAFCTAFPQLFPEDIWLEATSDVRYAVRTVDIAAGLRHVPIIYLVTMSPLSPTAPHYDLPRPAKPPLTFEGRAEL